MVALTVRTQQHEARHVFDSVVQHLQHGIKYVSHSVGAGTLCALGTDWLPDYMAGAISQPVVLYSEAESDRAPQGPR